MANNVTNRLIIDANDEKVKEVLDYLKPKQPRKGFDVIDFENIIRMPKSKKDDWFNWRTQNWGTKWNAYNERRDGKTIYFDTAWSAPHPIIEEIAAEFYGTKFIHAWSDEAAGYNVGMAVHEYGTCMDKKFIEDNSKEAFELFFELHPDMRGCFTLINGRYEYTDE